MVSLLLCKKLQIHNESFLTGTTAEQPSLSAAAGGKPLSDTVRLIKIIIRDYECDYLLSLMLLLNLL